jgi:hypothetical protein
VSKEVDWREQALARQHDRANMIAPISIAGYLR